MNFSQHLRFIWIEGRARTNGKINRSEVCEAWSISMPQATKDLMAFSDLFPGLLVYDVRQKCYLYKKSRKRFVPSDRARETIREMQDFMDSGGQ